MAKSFSALAWMSCLISFSESFQVFSRLPALSAHGINGVKMSASAPASVNIATDHDILLRVARGEDAERTPVWLMRQAGRYMKAFREYSDKYPFRVRSETPEIAVELSLQPWKAFGVDGVIMFSDILTPLPSLGVEFDVIKGHGPVISNPLRTAADIEQMTPLGDPSDKLGFVGETLQALKKEVEGKTTLVGFIGAPWTMAAYSCEGGSSKNCMITKKMMMEHPQLFDRLMNHLAVNLADYACYQVENGAQVLQIFESWAHQLSPAFFSTFAKPYADLTMKLIKERYPDVPVIYFANGGSSYLERQSDMNADMICVDWAVDMAQARQRLGKDKPISGNVDPLVLLGPKEGIVQAVTDCIKGGGGSGHILNLGHGVVQQTPEEAVGLFVETAKSISTAEIKSL